MLNRITFFSSVEFPTTAPSPTIAFPLINAQCLISAFFPIIAGPCMYAVGATVADYLGVEFKADAPSLLDKILK